MGYHPQPEPNPFWAQAAWFIDPVGGNDDNDGATAATAVKTWNVGVLGKLGTKAPLLTQDTSFTFLSSQADPNDVVNFEPFCQRCTWIMQGTRTQVTAGNLAAASVTAKDRATGHVLQIDLSTFPLAAVGQLVVNATRGNSVAFISKDLGGGLFELTQPLDPVQAPPVSAYVAPVGTENDAWVAGDAVTFYSLSDVYGGVFHQISGEYVTPNLQSSTLADLHFLSPDGPGNSNVTFGRNVSLLNCWVDQEILDSSGGGGLTTLVIGCLLSNVYSDGAGFERAMIGGALVTALFGGTSLAWVFDLDVLLDGSLNGIYLLGTAQALNTCQFGLVGIRGTVALVCTGAAAFGGIAGGASILYSATPAVNATFAIVGRNRLEYHSGAGKAVATFLNLTFYLNNQTNANAFDPATGTWSAPIAITAANLDTAFGGGGFGGLAVNVGGASISNQGAP